jgi:PAS domain S-box-containing protein
MDVTEGQASALPPGPSIAAEDRAGLLQLIVDESADCVAVYDGDGRLRSASRSVSAHLGFEAAALQGTHLVDLAHQDEAQLVSTVISGLRGGRAQIVELRLRCADGSARWMEMNARPVLHGGASGGFVAIFRDVQERRGAERAGEHGPAPACAEEGYLELGPDGAVVHFNRRYLELLGFTGAEIAKVEASSDRAMSIADIAQRKVADRGGFMAGSGRHAHSPGEPAFEEIPLLDGRTLERYAAPRRDPGGAVTGRLLFLRDVTLRRCSEEELRQRARQHETVAELSEIAITTADPQPLLHLAAKLVASTLGVDLVRIIELDPGGETFVLTASNLEGGGMPAGTCSPAAGSMAQFALDNRAPVVSLDLASERRFAAPVLLQLGIVSSAMVVVYGRDQPFGVLGAHAKRVRAFTRDDVHFLEAVANVLAGVLARRDAEKTLLDRERQLRAVFEHALDPLATFDDEGRFVELNPAACRLFERPRSELLGQPVASLFGPDGERRGTEAFGKLIQRGRLSGEAAVVTKPGQPPRQVEFSAVANILPGLHLAALRDVSEQRAMQARLALAERMASVGTLAAGVAHELNNPLAYVSANLSWIAEGLSYETESPGEAAESRADMLQAIKEAREGADRMREIIRDLRTFSRGDETGSGPVDLAPVLVSSVSMAWNEIRHRARLVRDLAPVPAVRGNEARLGQVFLNLLVNAAQAMPERDAERNEIRLVTRARGDGRVVVEVHDNGCGIAPEHRGRVFDPFFTTKEPGIGTGLGLSICHNLVTSLGGSIEVESAPGEGSVFRVTLLQATERAEPTAPPAEVRAAPAERRGRVLVVDDEALVAAAVRRALAAEHDVTTILSGREALDHLVTHPDYDVVISDLLMPGMTGVDLWDAVQARSPELAARMIFVTGGAFTPSSREFVEAHRESCLHKPFDLDQLRELVRSRVRR